MDFYDQENRDGVRFVWNTLPTTKLQTVRIAVPPAVHYSPLANLQLATLQYTPLTCKCQAVLNRFNPINFNLKTFTCVFCQTVQQLPPGYANQISPDRLPYELTKDCTTFECKLTESPHPPTYLFVVDLCISEEELTAIKEEIGKVLAVLPPETNVGLITFNKFVQVYELVAKINTVYCVSGSKDYTNLQIMDVLGLVAKHDPRGICQDVGRKFLVPLGPNRDRIIKRIKDIKPDQFIYVNERPLRALSSAFNIAITLAQCAPITPRIISFIGGPCTVGPGKVIDVSFSKMMRTHDQLYKQQNIEYFKKSQKYYQGLSKRLIAKKIIVDMFAFTLDQFGMLEMKKIIECGGGFFVLQEMFASNIFRDSFKKLMVEDQENVFKVVDQAQITILNSKEIAINGVLGQCVSLKKPPRYPSELEIGEGATNSWHLGSLDPTKTLTVLYENNSKQKILSRNYFLQFKTIYRYKNAMRMRVTTVCRQFAQDTNTLTAGFDQQAAAMALARYAVYKAVVQQQPKVSNYLDKTLLRFTSHFANYTRDDIQSFSLPPQMKSFPQFLYHLRRCQFISTFGTSPDECYYYRYSVYRENTQNCISMIQPALLQYTLEDLAPAPVMLDEESMREDVILLLDSYFVVILWQGQHVKGWEDNGYHEQQGYEHIRDLLNAPNQDIDYIISTRFPTPNYFKTWPGHSKQRYLKSRVNPKKGGEQNQNLITDDANIKAFTEFLVRMVVTKSQAF